VSKDISFDDIEIRAIKEAYDALKCLDQDGVRRAMTWLESKFHDEHSKPKAKHSARDGKP
jgi:hypothetical protein